MATVRAGAKGVLLVVDVQVGVMKEAWEAGRVIANVARTVARARAQGVPVVWVQQTDDDELRRDTPDWQWVPALVPAAGEARVFKAFNSAFEQTTLETHLAELGATHLVLAGASSSWCIRATAHGALEHGYDLTLVADAHTAETMVLDDGLRIEAPVIVAELNLAMTWMDYPGRISATARAEDVDFTTPRSARG